MWVGVVGDSVLHQTYLTVHHGLQGQLFPNDLDLETPAGLFVILWFLYSLNHTYWIFNHISDIRFFTLVDCVIRLYNNQYNVSAYISVYHCTYWKLQNCFCVSGKQSIVESCLDNIFYFIFSLLLCVWSCGKTLLIKMLILDFYWSWIICYRKLVV